MKTLTPTLVSTARMTQDDFGEWLESPWARGWIGKIELLDGLVVCEPPASDGHSDVVGEIFGHMWTFVRRNGLGRIRESSCGIELPSGDTVAPDIAFISSQRYAARGASKKGFLRAVPELVVEVTSPSTAHRDRKDKKRIYERNRVIEYWIVERESREVLRYVRKAKRFDRGRVFTRHDTVVSTVLAGFALPVAEIFANE